MVGNVARVFVIAGLLLVDLLWGFCLALVQLGQRTNNVPHKEHAALLLRLSPYPLKCLISHLHIASLHVTVACCYVTLQHTA